MAAVAKAVHRGADGSVHYLSSSPDHSVLIITDPVLGVDRIELDGPCRLIPRGPNLPASYDSVVYESISATGSTRVDVSPGQPAFLHVMGGVCWSCAFTARDGGHDYDLWPTCPSENRRTKRDEDRGVVRLAPRPEDTAAVSSPGTGASSSAPPVEGRADPLVRVFDPQFTPAPVEPVTPPEIRWGPGPGASW
jgi:hypothetical protein